MLHTTVFLVDDHTMLRAGVEALIHQQSDLKVVGTASDGHAALAQIEHLLPNVVVMDISMPGISGIEVTAQIHSRWPDVHVVVLTRHAEPGYIRQVLQAGARAYVLKQAPAEELIEAIRMVATGRVYLDSTLSKYVTNAFVERQNPGTTLNTQELSERETDVVRLIAQGYGNKETASQLGISVKTVDTYKARAMEKLGLYNRAALVRYALTQGWLDQE